MGKMTYGEQLKHPNWQRKRLEALQAAEFHCERCGDGESTLHVHHKRYVKGRMPWEYARQELAVLCEQCHADEHEATDARNALIAQLDMDGPLGIDGFFAYAAGGVSMFDWMVDADMQAMLASFRNGNPLQFEAGRVGALIAEMGCGRRWNLRAADLQHIGDLIGSDEAFQSDLVDLFRRHGVKVVDEKDAPGA